MTQDVNVDYISSPEAARILRITYVGVAQLARQGRIPAVKIANRWLIPRAFVEEFAQTYEGRRGRPRKRAPLAEVSESPDVTLRDHLEHVPPSSGQDGWLQEGIHTAPDSREPGAESVPALAATTRVERQEETPVPADQPVESASADAGAVSAADITAAETGAALAEDAVTDHPVLSPPSTVRPDESQPEDANVLSGTGAFGREGDGTFAISAEVFHLDRNYDFEVHEKGEITEQARLIVARLKPKIPSLPQFSFRWDYRYEHLNVDIHGVEPAVVDWWTMGENGYTGHLPRRLGGPGYAFEAVIWLPVTFVFRGRLTLSLRDIPEAEEDSPSVATTTGGLRKLWARWPKIRSSE